MTYARRHPSSSALLRAPVFILALLAGALPPSARAADAGDAARAHCDYNNVADLPIHYAGSGLQPAVDGVINGKPATMLVDTGAFETQMTMNGVARHDLSVFATGRYAQGIGGPSRLYVTRLREFSIGPSRSANRTDLYVVNDPADTPVFDAIAGANFLLQMDLEIDLLDKRLRLLRPHGCDDTPLLLWKEDTQAIRFQPHADTSPNPHFLVTVDGKDLDAIIDTGAHHTVMTLDAARRIGIDVDGPGARRLSDVGGIGSRRAPHWAIRTGKIEIGAEVVNNAEIAVVDSQGAVGPDLLLGQDFLRAHRVLFAMSQKKLYFAYLGGEVFTRSDAMPDWMRSEAQNGNPDAEYALAAAYASGNGVAADRDQAEIWLRKADAAGQPNARLQLGRRQMLDGHLAEAIPRLRGALDQLPANRQGALWLYIARVRNGEAALAQSELQASLDKQRDDAWPQPVAEFYLGKLDAARLLEEAGKDKPFAHARTCAATSYMAEWHAAHGQQAQADALKATLRTECAPGRTGVIQPAQAGAAP